MVQFLSSKSNSVDYFYLMFLLIHTQKNLTPIFTVVPGPAFFFKDRLSFSF